MDLVIIKEIIELSNLRFINNMVSKERIERRVGDYIIDNNSEGTLYIHCKSESKVDVIYNKGIYRNVLLVQRAISSFTNMYEYVGNTICICHLVGNKKVRYIKGKSDIVIDLRDDDFTRDMIVPDELVELHNIQRYITENIVSNVCDISFDLDVYEDIYRILRDDQYWQ